MSSKEAITAGIAAHGMWKQRLIDAINTGKSAWTPATVQLDNQCEFGKWLHSCPPSQRSPAHYAKIKELHALFHQEAAKVLELALKGKKSAAETAISATSKYREYSAALTREMMAWKSEAE